MNPWEKRRDESSPKKELDLRSEWDRDFARIAHSASFRSLQGKPQILNLGDSDFYRTRLTHTIEVLQLSISILRQLGHQKGLYEDIPLPDQTLLQAICLAHDLGHPPFGHGGEVALNFCMRDHGGFEGNGQTLRILTKLEKFSKNSGANLTKRTLLGALKYPIKYSDALNKAKFPCLYEGSVKGHTSTPGLIDREKSKPPKCYLDTEEDVVKWLLSDLAERDREKFLETKERVDKHTTAIHKSFDCSIMDVCDDIAYGVHDLEDAIVMGFITRGPFEAYETSDRHKSENCMSGFLEWLKENYPAEYTNDIHSEFLGQLFSERECKRSINRMVGYFTERLEVKSFGFNDPLLNYKLQFHCDAKKFIDFLKDVVYALVISNPRIQHLEFKGQKAVVSVFEVFASDPKAFLPSEVYEPYVRADKDLRVICDYIAGMTDATLLKIYDRLFSPRMGSIFDKL